MLETEKIRSGNSLGFSLDQSPLFNTPNEDNEGSKNEHELSAELLEKDEGNTNDFDTQNPLLFASSKNFDSIPDRQDPNQFEMSDSLLFSGVVPAKDASQSSIFNMSNSILSNEPSNGQNNALFEEGNRDSSETAENSPELEDTTYRGKEVKLFTGEKIRLKPKRRQRHLASIEELGQESSGNLYDMDVLFDRVREQQKDKENRDKLLSLEKQTRKPKKNESIVWSEKYKPKNFLQICSAGNDKQYRLVSSWLKKWSAIVHGEDFVGENIDALGRPHKKVLLVHGPLGIGKTAIVHILAKQLGYSVQELNAANSMDTLPQASSATGNAFQNASAALKLKIINALTTNSITSKGRPTCLVIDEIDSSINANEIVKVLNDLCQSDQRTLSRNKQGNIENNTNTKKLKKKPFVLNRPIICIANDIYLTSSSRYSGSPMEKLRPLCEMVAFKKPQSTKSGTGSRSSGNALRSVKDHLMKISQFEKLGLDYQQINEIVEVCECDMRACINYLQFNGRKLDPTIYTLRGEKTNGNKDTQLTWFAMVDQLFKRDAQLSKDEAFEKLLDLISNGKGKSAVSSSGSLDKVVRGCFNRYLDVVHLQDDSLKKPSQLSDWFSFYDNIKLENDANNYSSLVTMKVWSLFSEINPRKHASDTSLIPNSRNLDFETMEVMKQNKSTVKRLLEIIPLSAKVSMGFGSSESSESFSCHILPFLDRLLSPELASNKIKQDHEIKSIQKCANLVHSFNLKLESQKDVESGLITLHFSNDWDSIVNFENHLAPINSLARSKLVQNKRHRLFPLIKSEIELMLMASRASKRRIEDGPISKQKEEAEKENTKKKRAKPANSVDFFKNKYDGLSSQLQKDNGREKDPNHEATRIWVKYNEGFSNAVRKNIGWAELWLH